MKTPKKVYGADCLNYIDKPIAFASHCYKRTGAEDIAVTFDHMKNYFYTDDQHITHTRQFGQTTTIEKWDHDTSSKKIGVILKKYDDGGLQVAILGSDRITNGTYGNFKFAQTRFLYGQGVRYSLDGENYVRQYVPTSYPTNDRTTDYIYETTGTPRYSVVQAQGNAATFDETLNFNPMSFLTVASAMTAVWVQNNQRIGTFNRVDLTDDETTTAIFGVGLTSQEPDGEEMAEILTGDPLQICAGNFYQYAQDLSFDLNSKFITRYPASIFGPYGFFGNNVLVKNTNLTSIPYNLILTEDVTLAKKYLRDGTLPPDAFLYPLDFDNLPQYTSEEDDDESDTDENLDDGDERNVDENLPEVPSYTGGSLNNNNVYLLLPGELNDIINWFWNDVGDVTDFQDLMTKIEGLANNLAQNFLMFRIMPVNPAWIGGYGDDSSFIVGGVEKSGTYKTLAKRPATVEEIGHYHFDDKYTSYKFLNYEPYSDFKLYLPYHGIVDLDVGVYQGHDLYVKAVYDYLSGTITYMLYCDNVWLTNTYTAKMCVDLNISLQSKNERDNAIYSNVTNAVAGIMGAGSTLATGNPIGLAIGANAIVTQGQSAPYKVMASVGEDGAFYAPQKCAVLIRRPKLSRPDTYKESIGRQSFGSYKLSDLKGKGFTTVINPRLSFTQIKPLQEEIDELNELLETGVFL